ncbi:MAG: hypothetical protein EHM70_05400 [Chloroflexota bacterium]|nr:MAG: hypothetical protein EHM70_05400 [Chloroflexota bacterium]
MKTNNIYSFAKRQPLLVAMLIIALLLFGALAGCSPNNADSSVRTQDLSEPLGDVTTAKFDVNTGTGNLTIDQLTGGEPLLAGGSLEYLESQGVPTRSLTTINDQATLTWAASGTQQTGFRFPWEACNGETEWLIHLNPRVSYDLNAYSEGGNVKLNLAGLAFTRITAETGGGNMEMTLPDHTANLSVMGKTGGGNVTVAIGSSITGSHTVNASSGAGSVVVRLPGGIAARIHVASGMGNAIVDPSFTPIDNKTYQSPDYDSAANRVEITADSGAGNVTIETIE